MQEICQRPKFIAEGATRFDVEQGELGDPWLLSAVSSLTLTPRFLDRVVPPDQSFEHGYCGVFRFRFWHFGDWVEVLVDDRLPTYKGRLVYLHSTDPAEFWAALLEKAYAKVIGLMTSQDLMKKLIFLMDSCTAAMRLCTAGSPPRPYRISLGGLYRASPSPARTGCSHIRLISTNMKHFFQQIASINSVLQLIVKRLREQENHVNYLCSGSQQRSAPVHPADRQHQHGQGGQV